MTFCEGLRDKALVLLAYDSLCRRSELVSIRLDDIECDGTGLPIRIRLRESKTDQEAIGKLIKTTSKTHKAIKSWIDISEIKGGCLFRGIRNNGEVSQSINLGENQ